MQHPNGTVSTYNGSSGFISEEGGGFKKYLGNSESTLAGIWKNTFTKIEAYAGMTERMVIDLAISEALQNEIKETL